MMLTCVSAPSVTGFALVPVGRKPKAYWPRIYAAATEIANRSARLCCDP